LWCKEMESGIKWSGTGKAMGLRGVNRGMQIRRFVMIYKPNPPLKFRPESEIRAKIFSKSANLITTYSPPSMMVCTGNVNWERVVVKWRRDGNLRNTGVKQREVEFARLETAGFLKYYSC